MTSGTAASHSLVWQPVAVTRAQHQARNQHRGLVVWLTGLPGSGKSTLARAVEEKLHHGGFSTTLLDGDNLRHGLCSDLGFSIADRNENVRRTGEVAKLFLEVGVVAIVALVSPMRAARDALRASLAEDDFLEVYCQCSLDVCKRRDPKGHYAKADSGALSNFTGVSSIYEAPMNPSLTLDTANEHLDGCVDRLMHKLLCHIER
jgi:adenylylsulfate kinase